jgi:hypothetical protein
MKIKLVHSLWTHLPAAAALFILIGYIISAGPLPAVAPVHFNASGAPDRYGSPWIAFGLNIGLSVLFILISIIIDELWARQEKAKSFNWLALLDEIVVGTMAGTGLGYLNFLTTGSGTFGFPWTQLLFFSGGTMVLAVIVETFRPYRPDSTQTPIEESRIEDAELAEQLKKGSSFVYWDYQNPFYITLLTTALPLVMFISAIFSWSEEAWVAVLLCAVGLLLIIPYGGQRTLVTRQEVTVRWGIFGIKVLQLKVSEIANVETHEFAPLKDFGGYGIRFNREMKAYFLQGTRGAKITTAAGKKYLIGSDHAERLVAVISAGTGLQD